MKEELLKRIRTAVEFLEEGQAFTIGDLLFGMADREEMFVSAASKYQHRKDLTKEIAKGEIDQIKEYFFEMAKASIELKSFIKDKVISFRLAVNDGMGAIPICFEKNGVVEWMIDTRD